jgi:hypothetical protein
VRQLEQEADGGEAKKLAVARRKASDPSGLARAQLNFAMRRSGGRDSGRTKNP